MSVYVFPAIIHKEDDNYGVVFPDLPGCISVGDSQHEIALNAAEALGGHLEAMLEDDDPLPEPSQVEQLKLKPDEGDIAVILVTAYAVKPRTVAA
ncbi:MAG: type II toxin-antitoxin system HicB family antitoxin [Hyphomonadaceae bacterium]